MPHASILTSRLLLGVPVALLLAGCASRRDAVPPVAEAPPATHRLSIKDTPEDAPRSPGARWTTTRHRPAAPAIAKPVAPAPATTRAETPPARIAAPVPPPRILPPMAEPVPAPVAKPPVVAAPMPAPAPKAEPAPAQPRAAAPSAPRAAPPAVAAPAAKPPTQARPLIRQRRGEALEAPLTPKVIAPVPPASATDPRLSAILVQMEPLLQAGKVDGARALLADLVKARHADAIAELARTYDPVALQAYRLPPGTADPAKAAELYVEAQKLGSTMARERFDRLKSWLATPR